MTIEASASTASVTPANASESANAKEGTGHAGKAHGKPVGGFTAILAAIDVDVSVVPKLPAVDPLDAKSGQTTSIEAGKDGLLLAGEPMDAAALIAQALQGAASSSARLDPKSKDQSAVLTDVIPPPVAGIQYIRQMSSADVDGPRRTSLLGSSKVPHPESGDMATLPFGEKVKFDPVVKADSAVSGPLTNQSHGHTALMALALNQDQGKLPLISEVTRGTQLPVEVQTIAVAATVFREKVAPERSVFRAEAQDPVYSPQAQMVGGAFGAAETGRTSVPTEFQVAEKVSYWISHDVQNAELKLDGIGKDPVEVTIRMHGNEAHVAFRTDEIQTRAVLESAGDHLRDLLQREGLILSGVSVGTSGPGDSNAREQRNARQAVVRVGDMSADLKPSVSNRIPDSHGRAVDLFV